MRGTKRSATSDSTPLFNSNDSFMQSNRVIMGSQLDAKRAVPSLPQPQSLDVKRAESSRQHVRALNAQFASWIQTQLQSHPDELWGDGVQDYLNHANGIVERFSDVVDWIKANAAKGESINQNPNNAQLRPNFGMDETNHKLFLEKPGSPSPATARFGQSGGHIYSNDIHSKPILETDKNNHNFFGGKPSLPLAENVKFGAPWAPGPSFNRNMPFTFGGNQVSVPANTDTIPSNKETSNEENDDDIERPSSPSVKKSEEKGIRVVHEVKCKLYVKSIDPKDEEAWTDKGKGQLSIKCQEGVGKGTKESKPTIIIRNDVGKVLLNALLYLGIKTNVLKNSVISIFHTSGDGDDDSVVARTFLMRTKTGEDAVKLSEVIQEYAPVA